MKFKLYVLEIKNRVLLITFSFITCLFVSYCYKETLLFLTIKNLKPENETNSLYFISTNLTEILSSYFKLSYINSSLLVSILLLYHVLIFFGPALSNIEYYTVKEYVIKSFLFFFFGFYIFNTYLLPIFWNFFLNFQGLYSLNTMNIYFEGRMEEYIDFYTKTCFFLIFISQFCVSLVLILDRIKEKVMFIRNSKKILYLFFLIISTAITPPDVFSQLSTFLCFFIIFENLILITFFKYYLIRKPIET